MLMYTMYVLWRTSSLFQWLLKHQGSSDKPDAPFKLIGRRISRATNDPRRMSYIFQQISVAIIRGNALAMTASSRRYAQELVERH